MEPGLRCAGFPNRPSGHSAACGLCPFPTEPLPCYPDITACLPEENRQSYEDFDTQDRNLCAPIGRPDNLFPGGNFYNGVSETHDEFRNRGGIQPKKFHEYVRHHEEPGLKFDKSITYTDFRSPHPEKKSASFRKPVDYQNDLSVTNSPKRHAKEYKRRSSEPEVYYIEAEPKWTPSTEYSDNYICYQRPKLRNELKDLEPSRNEIFLERVRGTHECCPYGLPTEMYCAVVDHHCRQHVLAEN
ncbi:hypothetical protein JTE90_010916 [Oedothorax gibbosus]|uniref:Uncharacterized protein n=1 Tax=Oedothorax gibbosus TaxID=931172 RepID=A0AAV6UH38_9ARAC|nr:hypothetical protein JTE90_010916 [Oedothorax gibbosus]